ncbi:MAG: radical SAM protein [Candidatus Nitrosocaldaceae archaeon]|nr:MAG: radical SAM protein [Candidatus Nitrosocaldaceae archaeon]
MGKRVILTNDRTLTSEYRSVPLFDFMSCAPSERVPDFVFRFLAPDVPMNNGILSKAPYGLRKIEAGLLRSYKRDEVAVIHPDYLERYIDMDTRIVGIYAMDPLGLAPVSMMFTGGQVVFTPINQKYFVELALKLKEMRLKHGYKFKVVVGGPGAWQFEFRHRQQEELMVDHAVIGEADHIADELFREIESKDMPPRIRVARQPRVDEIPEIVNASIHGVVEVMRGCGRNCEFCEPNLRIAKYFPYDKVTREVAINVKAGTHKVWVHSDDIFLYGLEDKRSFMPNKDAILGLFDAIMNVKGVVRSQPTHGTVSAAVADPDMIRELSTIIRASDSNIIGIQPGMETGSGNLIKKYMPYKAKPFAPEEWPDVIFHGTRILNENYWFPAYTLILGLPGETEEDNWDTVRLIDRLEKELPERIGNKAHFTATPLTFVPIGVLKGDEFFNAANISESHYAIIYRTWRHTIYELYNAPPRVINLNPFLKPFMMRFFKWGANLILKVIEDWGRKLGYDPEKSLLVKYA